MYLNLLNTITSNTARTLFERRLPKIKQVFFYLNINSRKSGAHTRTQIYYFFKTSANHILKSNPVRSVGRTAGGTITVYTIGSRKRIFKINYATSYRSTKMFVIVLKYVRDFLTNKIAALCMSMGQEIFYLPQTSNMRLLTIMIGTLTCNHYSLADLRARIQQYRIWEVAAFLKTKTRVCYFTDTAVKKIKFCKACGVCGKVVKQVSEDTIFKTTIILPTKQVKVVDGHNVLLLGNIVGKKKKFFKYTRAGYYRSIGHKQTVRGVAKNPVDHPHGGRTKSVRWPRTPWGISTK